MERIAGCPNLRDMGGIKVENGYVKPGRLIRSGALWRLEDKDIEKLGSIAAVYDMRSENERAYHPDPEIPGAEYIHIPITENGRRRFVQSKRTLPDKVEDMLEGYRCSEPASAQRMREVYSGMVLSADAGRCLEGIIRTVVEQREGAVIYHCSAGKDRAGVISALLLRLLGAEDSAIYADYLYTNTALSHELEEAQSAALALSDDERAANYVLGFFAACPCWLAAALGAQSGADTGGVMIRAVGVAIVAEFGAQLCRDAGEGALAGRVEMAGRVTMLTLALPLLTDLVTRLSAMMP